MQKIKTFHKKKILVVFMICFLVLAFLIGRLGFLMLTQSEYYSKKAEQHHSDGGNAITDKRGGYLSHDTTNFFATQFKVPFWFLFFFHISCQVLIDSLLRQNIYHV